MTQYDSPDQGDDEMEFDDESMRDSVGVMSEERAQRFYDRVRNSIARYLERKGGAAAKSREVLLLVPDVFNLLWRLVNDASVNAKNKVLLASGLAYFVFPLDIIPEAFAGPMGYMDDLVFAVFILNRMIADTDAEVLRRHWSGSGDILETIRRILGAADNMIGSDMVNKVKRLVK